jgi:hypothetical protein
MPILIPLFSIGVKSAFVGTFNWFVWAITAMGIMSAVTGALKWFSWAIVAAIIAMF